MSTSNNVSPRSTSPPPMNVIVSQKGEPPHYSALISKIVNVGGNSVLVEEVIAEGGFGVIFLVKGIADKTKYALKRVVVNNDRDYNSVITEVDIMSSMGHLTPHILSSLSHVIVQYACLDYTREIQNLMPLCKQNVHGLATSRISKSGNFTESEVMQVLSHVAAGLQYLHTSTPAIIHRDIKLENILVLDDTYVLSDFGSSTTKTWDPSVDKLVSIQEDLDKYTTLVYRSPEMVDLYGNRGPISIQSDIWALGCCGYKLMSFKDPFDTILAIQNRNINWNIKIKYNDNLVKLIDCLLAENQHTRPTIQDTINLLSSVSSGESALVNRVYSKILEAKKESDGVVKKSANSGAVVLETSVTPRQRPKRAVVPATVSVIPPPVIPAPPKSPKPVSPCERELAAAAAAGVASTSAAAPSTTPNSAKFFSPQATLGSKTIGVVPPASSPLSNKATPSPQPSAPVTSWNPFDEDYGASRPQYCDNECVTPKQETSEQDDDDPFARAPFDYFKYQPIMVNANESSSSSRDQTQEQDVPQWYAPNNPFLNYINNTQQHSTNNIAAEYINNTSFKQNNNQ
ncbi:unnamed protein product [Orchesella dallaii]|uniref:non-specific serine/threonine protein kinase n=1 Tax=Orchesella dallaii TaxID=48710 RepID=A0ABP1Q6E7_9HEXA